MLKPCVDLESSKRKVPSFARRVPPPPLGFLHLYRISLEKGIKLSLQTLRENNVFIWLSSFQWSLLLQLKFLGHSFYHWYLQKTWLKKKCISHVTWRLISQCVSCHQRDTLSLKFFSGLLLKCNPEEIDRKDFIYTFRITGSKVRELEIDYWETDIASSYLTQCLGDSVSFPSRWEITVPTS